MEYARTFAPGETLGTFTIEKLLGRGAFKSVYRALASGESATRYPERVALCVPHTQDPEARKLIENEYRIISGLDHPGIVKIYALETTPDCFFTVMELVAGETLDQLLARRGPLPLAEAVQIIRLAGVAIDYAHDCLAIHRDLKPANIVLCPDGAVKLLDFGLARLMAHSQYKALTRVGSVAFMPPEQFEGAAGLNADIWSLGMTFFHLVTNTFPFIADNEATLVKQILYDPPDLDPIEHLGCDPRLNGIFSKVLAKDPEKRYRRAAEFVADLDAVLRHAAAVTGAEGEIEAVLRAHFPLIYIQTCEEERVLASLGRIRRLMSVTREVGLYIWSETRGLWDREGRSVAPETAGDPLLALQHVVRSDAEGIYVFLDIHRHLTPVTVRLVRDAIWTVKRRRKSLVFVSPVISIPRELEADTTLMFYDLPDMEHLQELALVIAGEQGARRGQGDDSAVAEALARALLGLTLFEAERVLRRSMFRTGGFTRDCVREVLGEKQQIVRKAGLLEFYHRTAGFDAVGGLAGLKGWFHKRRQAFTGAGRLYGLPAPKGVVLAGAPGCGKSLSAKALATEWGVPLLRLDMGRIYSSLLGSSEANLRKALHTAEAVSPCILWIDELEKAFGGGGGGLDGGVAKRVFGTFLNWLEERTSAVFVAATANSITRLPPEFTRKGRFDEIFFVGLPQTEERQAIFSVHLQRRGRRDEEFDLPFLAEKSAGFSGAEIEEAVIAALYQAFEEGERGLATADILAAMAATVPMSRSRGAEMEALQRWAVVNARLAQ